MFLCYFQFKNIYPLACVIFHVWNYSFNQDQDIGFLHYLVENIGIELLGKTKVII